MMHFYKDGNLLRSFFVAQGLLKFSFIIFQNKYQMLKIAYSSETFQKLLFGVDSKSSAQKPFIPAILASLKSHTAKKNNIVIISNGVEQKQSRTKRKRYVFSDDQISDESSHMGSYCHQKKHVIKKQKKEDPDYSVKKQKSDRNVISNIIHHLMKHTLTNISDQMLQKIFEQKQINMSNREFHKVLNEKDKMCKTYITNKHLKLLWDDSAEPEFSKVMRIISRIFLQNYSFLTIFNGNKLNKESKAIHYKGRRELIQFLSKLK